MQQCVHAAAHTCTHIYKCTQCSVLMQHAHTHACVQQYMHACSSVCASMLVPTAVGVHADLCVQQCLSMQQCMHAALHVCTHVYKRTQHFVLMQHVHIVACMKQCKRACSNTCTHSSASVQRRVHACTFLSARRALCLCNVHVHATMCAAQRVHTPISKRTLCPCSCPPSCHHSQGWQHRGHPPTLSRDRGPRCHHPPGVPPLAPTQVREEVLGHLQQGLVGDKRGHPSASGVTQGDTYARVTLS